MKRLLALVLLFSLTPCNSFAWGRVGHAAVADIAESRLTPEARRQVELLLAVEGKKHLSEIASWADGIKSEHRPESPAHSIRLALDHNDTIDNSLCPSHYCAVQGIEDYYKKLGNKSLPLEQREVALKYLVHLVGDIHQPLHASVATGGNVAIDIAGKKTNLHGVWDDEIIYTQGRDPQAIAAALEANIPGSRLNFGGTPTDWALESRAIARDSIYTHFPQVSAAPVPLSPEAVNAMWPIVASRLTQAGARLANLLNSALR